MRAIKKEDLENINYYQTPKWLFELLLEGKITPGAYCLYMLMYDRTRLSSENNWVDESGEVYILYSWDNMRKARKVKSNTQIKRDLDKLYELDLLQVKYQYKNSNIYYLNIYSETEENRITQNVEDDKEVELHNLSELDCTDCDSRITQSVDGNNNNLNNNNIIITTTKQDNINLIEENQSDEKDNSSFSESIKELKQYLFDKIQDIPTCKNIMFLVENRDLKLERIKEVVEYANKNLKGIGFIYKALEENWILQSFQDSTFQEKEYKRGHGVNLEAMNTIVQAEEEKNKYYEKVKRLEKIYIGLGSDEKEKIDKEAYEKSLKIYGSIMAKTMAKTKTKYEILSSYI